MSDQISSWVRKQIHTQDIQKHLEVFRVDINVMSDDETATRKTDLRNFSRCDLKGDSCYISSPSSSRLKAEYGNPD